MAELHGTHCCGVGEFSGISYDDGPTTTIDKFCRKIAGDSYQAYNRSNKEVELSLYGHYIFTDVVRVTGENHGYYRTKTGYGEKLAKFIKDNKLGTIIQTKAAANHINHPNHYIVVWVWTPNVKNVRAWWAKRQAKDEGSKPHGTRS